MHNPVENLDMDQSEFSELIHRRPGYEVLYLLLQSDRRRKELGDHAGVAGGTLQRWLDDAEEAGVVVKNKSIRNDEVYTEYSLDIEFPYMIQTVICDRGKEGPRTENNKHADKGAVNMWFDRHSLEPDND